MISIIIPFKDRVYLLKKCVSSIFKKTAYMDYEIILVNNQSKKRQTKNYLENIKNERKIKILNYDNPFNFSAINNFAVKTVNSEYVLFLNNDIEIISTDWLKKIVECFDNKNVGVVGAKLFYSNDTIQHAGIMLENEHVAIHAFNGWKKKDYDTKENREWSAVTGACMMTKRNLFIEAGGFDEKNLPIAYNDVDYCLRLKKGGLRIICVNDVMIYHYESASRTNDMMAKFFDKKRDECFENERDYMKKKWNKEIGNDIYYNENFKKNKSNIRRFFVSFFK